MNKEELKKKIVASGKEQFRYGILVGIFISIAVALTWRFFT